MDQEQNPNMIGMPPGYEPKPVETPEPIVDENAQAIARAKILQGQAMLERITPPAPGTPVEVFVPPSVVEATPPIEVVPATPQQPIEYTTEATVEAANRVSETTAVMLEEPPVEAPQQ